MSSFSTLTRVAQRTSFLWQSQAAACSPAQFTSFYVVASCGLLPRTTRPGPRVRTAFWSVANPRPREADVARAVAVAVSWLVQRGADQVQDSRVQDSRQVRRVERLGDSTSCREAGG